MTRTLLVKRKPGRMILLAILAFALIPVASASAGRMIVTGHDADFHCRGGAQCHFVKTATDWVRAGAPDPTKPVLILDTDDLDFPTALTNVNTQFGENIPNVVMDPKSLQFAAEPLTTASYSAILVASDTTCGGCDLNQNNTEDSDAINARTADIQAFFNAGGGVYANAGATVTPPTGRTSITTSCPFRRRAWLSARRSASRLRASPSASRIRAAETRRSTTEPTTTSTVARRTTRSQSRRRVACCRSQSATA
jgi:hypothetical protein